MTRRPHHQMIAAAIAALACAAPVRAQTRGEAGDDRPAVYATYEWRRDRFSYRFENQSSFDTEFLVPHEYEQRYEPSGGWIVAGARYRALGDVMASRFGFTPGDTIRASDIDTFFNPGGDVIRSGTAGRADWRAWRIEHDVAGTVAGLRLSAGYAYRRDRSDFLPADIVVTHSNPPSATRTPTTAREMTTSEQHRFQVRASRAREVGGAWEIEASGDVTPFVRARLTTELPDKYPGRKIRSDATGFAAGGGLRLSRRRGVPLSFSVRAGRGWSYGRASRFSSSEVSVTAGIEIRSAAR